MSKNKKNRTPRKPRPSRKHQEAASPTQAEVDRAVATIMTNPAPEINTDPPVGTLPDLGDPAGGELKADSRQPAKPEARSPKPDPQTITIEIPIGVLSTTGYITRHVEVNHLNRAQTEALNRLLNGLRAAGAKLTEGDRLVDKPPDAIRWVLEQLAEAGGSSQ